MRYLLCVFLVVSFSSAVRAQERDEADTGAVRLHFNISFVPGLSLADIIADHGVREVEVSGINLNVIGGSIDRLSGLSWSGVFGEAKQDAKGIESAGVFNINNGELHGMAGAGVFNVVKLGLGGFQGAGVFNVAGSVRGFQGAGVFNVDEADLAGGQGAGVFNTVEGSLRGIQMAGIFNTVTGDGLGAQLGGIFNSTDGEFRGVQMAGIFNTAGHFAAGLQLGVLNFADEHEGVPIGLISYVKSVGLRYDVWIDESQFGYLGVRSGTSRFYNVVALGAQGNTPFRWLAGAGFGYQVQFVGDLLLDIGVFSGHVNEQGDTWTNGTNLLNKLHCVGVIDLAGVPDLFLGVTLNVWVSDVQDGSDVAQYTFRSRRVGTTWIRVWPGLVAGVRF